MTIILHDDGHFTGGHNGRRGTEYFVDISVGFFGEVFDNPLYQSAESCEMEINGIPPLNERVNLCRIS